MFGRKKPEEKKIEQNDTPQTDASAVEALAKENMAGAGQVSTAARSVEETLSGLKQLDPQNGAANVGATRNPAHTTHQHTRSQTTGSQTQMNTTNGNGQNANGQNGNGQNGNGQNSDTIFTEATPGLEAGQKTVANMLGEITWLMSQSPAHKTFFISDLEWLVMTPILLKQFRVFYAKDRPIGVILWATVDEEVEERLKQGNAKLKPQDWKSGSKLWIVDIVAPYGGQDEMLKDIKAKVFPDQKINFLGVVDGKLQVKEG